MLKTSLKRVVSNFEITFFCCENKKDASVVELRLGGFE